MTRYRVPVADLLLLDKDFWQPVEGFRLISVDGPWFNHPHVTICTFEDDNAPAELEGKLVEPWFTMAVDADSARAATVTERNLIPEGTP